MNLRDKYKRIILHNKSVIENVINTMLKTCPRIDTVLGGGIRKYKDDVVTNHAYVGKREYAKPKIRDVYVVFGDIFRDIP